MKEPIGVTHVGFAEALAKGPPPPGNLAVPIFAHGSLVVELYQPVGRDPQKPHTRDEVYFVARGSGSFFDGERRHSVGPGSFLFVPAGQVHRLRTFPRTWLCGWYFMGRRVGRRRKRPKSQVAGTLGRTNSRGVTAQRGASSVREQERSDGRRPQLEWLGFPHSLCCGPTRRRTKARADRGANFPSYVSSTKPRDARPQGKRVKFSLIAPIPPTRYSHCFQMCAISGVHYEMQKAE